MPDKIHATHNTHQGCLPRLCVHDAAAALLFYSKAFGASEDYRLLMPDGRIGNAEFSMGTARFMITDEFPDYDAKSPQTLGGSPVTLHLYVKDVDSFCKKAVAEGLKVIRPITDEFYGDRIGKFQDPFGHIWMIATHIKDVSVQDMQKVCDSFGSKNTQK